MVNSGEWSVKAKADSPEGNDRKNGKNNSKGKNNDKGKATAKAGQWQKWERVL